MTDKLSTADLAGGSTTHPRESREPDSSVRTRDPIVPSLMAHQISAPQPVQQLKVLIKHVAPPTQVGLLPAVVPLERHRANPNPEHQPTPAQPIESHRLPGDNQRSPPRQRCHQGAQPNRPRRASRGG